MARVPIRIPKVSSATVEAAPTEWVVEEGDEVKAGEILYRVETEKVETEIPAAATGIVHWLVEIGEAYDVGHRIGYIETAD